MRWAVSPVGGPGRRWPTGSGPARYPVDRLGGARPARQPPRPRHRHPGRPDPRAQRQGPLLRACRWPAPTTSSAPTRSAPGRPAARCGPASPPARPTTTRCAGPPRPCCAPAPPTAWSGSAASAPSRCPTGGVPTIALVRPGHPLPPGVDGRDPGRHARPRPRRQRLPHGRRGEPAAARRCATPACPAPPQCSTDRPHPHAAGDRMTTTRLAGGRVYDPLNGIDGEVHGPVGPGRPDRRRARRRPGRTR